MTEPASKPTPRPPAVNGPAFLVFGLMAAVLGVSMRLYLLVLAGVVLAAIGVWGIVALRRYERKAGIEDVLPGQSPHDVKRTAAEGDADPPLGDDRDKGDETQ